MRGYVTVRKLEFGLGTGLTCISAEPLVLHPGANGGLRLVDCGIKLTAIMLPLIHELRLCLCLTRAYEFLYLQFILFHSIAFIFPYTDRFYARAATAAGPLLRPGAV